MAENMMYLQSCLKERQSTHESADISTTIVGIENRDEADEGRHEQNTEGSDDRNDLLIRSVWVSISQGRLKEDGPEGGDKGNPEVDLLVDMIGYIGICLNSRIGEGLGIGSVVLLDESLPSFVSDDCDHSWNPG